MCFLAVGRSGDGDGVWVVVEDALFWVVLHTVTFRSPMYGLCWVGSGCIAKLSRPECAVFRTVTFLYVQRVDRCTSSYSRSEIQFTSLLRVVYSLSCYMK